MESPQVVLPLSVEDNRLDHFVHEDGKVFAGKHLIVDMWGAVHLDDSDLMRSFLSKSILDCGATLLHMHIHTFTTNGGLSGVAVLAESHISFHTWPEMNFGAFDVFMCGKTKPHLLVDNLRAFFNPKSVNVTDIKRGDLQRAQ